MHSKMPTTSRLKRELKAPSDTRGRQSFSVSPAPKAVQIVPRLPVRMQANFGPTHRAMQVFSIARTARTSSAPIQSSIVIMVVLNAPIFFALLDSRH